MWTTACRQTRPNRVRTLRHICRLQEPNRDVPLAYARFIGETADYVLNALIDTTLARERDCVTWRADQVHGGATDSGAASGELPTCREPRSERGDRRRADSAGA